MSKTLLFVCFCFLLVQQPLSAQFITVNDINRNLSRMDIQTIRPVLEKQAAFHSKHLDLPSRIEIPVRVFTSTEDYRRHQKAISTSSTSKNGFYSASKREVIVNKNKNYLSTLKHEAQHFILRSQFRSPPKWINEGLSEFYESSTVRGGYVFVQTQNNKHKRLKQWIDNNSLPALDEWLNISNSEWRTQNKASEDRLSSTLSWGLVYFLMSSDNGKSVLSDTIRDLQNQKKLKSAEILNKHYRGGLKALQEDFEQFMQALPIELKL